MSIIGIGVDIINNNRLKKSIKNKNFILKEFFPLKNKKNHLK